MFKTNKQEQFSEAFLLAIAAKSGCTTSKPNVDDDSVDWFLQCKIANKMNSRPQIDIQLKCTYAIDEDKSSYKFALSIKNYNDLRIENIYAQRILLVVIVPEDENKWLYQTNDQLLLRKCGYWLSIRGNCPIPNTTSVTVSIPKVNLFTPKALESIMSRVADGAYV